MSTTDTMQPTQALTEAQAFYFEHAGYSHGPNESAEAGRTRCAISLARAEQRATDLGWELAIEESGERYGWHGKNFDVISNNDGWTGESFVGYDVYLRDANGNALPYNVGGVTFANDDPHEPYARVLFAELASEALGDDPANRLERALTRDEYETAADNAIAALDALRSHFVFLGEGLRASDLVAAMDSIQRVPTYLRGEKA